jgi:hypothetical protein
MRLAWHVARVEESRSVGGVLVGKAEKLNPLGRHRRRWGNIKIELQEVACLEFLD